MTRTISQALLGVAATMLLASTASAVNLLANSGFENPSTAPGVEYFGAPGWTDFGGTTFTINNLVVGPAGPYEGTQVLKVFGFGGVFQQFAASAGQQWDASVWALNDTADLIPPGSGQVAAINIEWIDGGGNNIGTVFGGTITGLTPSNVWQNLTASGVAVAGTAFARMVLITGDFLPGGQGGAPRFDGASFSVVPVPAAVWLFGSSLGLLGWFRRKSLA